MDPLTISVLGMGGLSAALSAALGVADRYLRVDSDPRVEEIVGILPGANCGGCGKPGCRAYAEAVVKGDTTPDKCGPGGIDVAREVAAVMGIEIGEMTRHVAVVHCRAGDGVRRIRAAYQGPTSCRLADLLGGQTECAWGCLGLGECVDACPFDAIHMADGLPVVDPVACTGCGRCVAVCPRDIISIEPLDGEYGIVAVGCRSQDRGPMARKVCDLSCLGCGICNRKSPNSLFIVESFLAVADLARICEHEDEADALRTQCPRGTIVRLYAIERAGSPR